jgi:hypothetical protein
MAKKKQEPLVSSVRSQKAVVAQVAHIYDSGNEDKQHIELIQFWSKFKGRRVRVWPSELTIRVCSESGKKWVTSAEGREPHWWEESRQKYMAEHQQGMLSTRDPLVDYAAEHLADQSVPQLETVEQAKLFEGKISEIVTQPPGIYVTEIQYWVVVPGDNGDQVAKVDSIDEALFLPLNGVARIDFVAPGRFRGRNSSSWD